MPNPLEEKKQIILKAEEDFAYQLASEVLKKPKLSVWMILIPIIIVFHIYRHQKVMEGRKGFAENYLVSRKRALEAAFLARTSGKAPDVEEIVRLADLPEETLAPYARWINALTIHYTDLLACDGADYPALIRAAYKNRAAYLLMLNRLNQVEREFDTCLKPQLTASEKEVEIIVSAMEIGAEKLRRELAAAIFP